MSLKRLQKIQLNILDKVGRVEKLVGKEGDNLTRGLEVQLLNNNIVVNDISTIDCALIAKQKSKEAEDTFVVPGKKANGRYQIIYPSNLMKKGIVEGELRFTQGEDILTSFIFPIDMARTLVVEEITDSIYEQRLIDVIVEVVANEEERVANEKQRKITEKERVSNESIREGNEDRRKDLYDLVQRKLNDGELNGKDLEFRWNGTRLGVRLKGESAYEYVDLKGAKGDKGDTGEVTLRQFESHTDNIGNPHSVTKNQVGLGNLNNYTIATKAEAEAGGLNTRFMTPLRTLQAIEANPEIVDSGSNSNGEWIKFKNGTVIATHRLKVTYNNGYRLRSTWTYPVAMPDTPNITFVVTERGMNSYPTNRDLSVPMIESFLSSAIISITTFRGAQRDFEAGNYIYVDLQAIAIP